MTAMTVLMRKDEPWLVWIERRRRRQRASSLLHSAPTLRKRLDPSWLKMLPNLETSIQATDWLTLKSSSEVSWSKQSSAIDCFVLVDIDDRSPSTGVDSPLVRLPPSSLICWSRLRNLMARWGRRSRSSLPASVWSSRWLLLVLAVAAGEGMLRSSKGKMVAFDPPLISWDPVVVSAFAAVLSFTWTPRFFSKIRRIWR